MVMPVTTGQVVPDSPSQMTSGGGFWGGLNSTLSNAFGMYLAYDSARNQRAATGAQLQDRQYVTELPNGAAVMIDETKRSATQVAPATHVDIGGMQVPKMALYGAAALAVVAILINRK